MSRKEAAVTLCAVLLAVTVSSSAEVAVPPLKSRVTDLTATLSSQQRAALEQTLSALEQRKGAQVAVLLVPTVEPETVDQFAVRVFEQWKLGRKGVDDGVLLLVAKNDRKVRVEVGYGLEGVLNDATARRIIEEEMVRRFEQADFVGGISASVGRIVKLIDSEPLPTPEKDSYVWAWGGALAFVFSLLVAASVGPFWAAVSIVLLSALLPWIVVPFRDAIVFGGLVLGFSLGFCLILAIYGAVAQCLPDTVPGRYGRVVQFLTLFASISGGRGGGGSRGGNSGGGGGSSGGGGASGRW